MRVARRLALVSVLASSLLAIANVLFGVMARSTSVVAVGVEFAGDVIASATVLFGLIVASKPPDADHPYGHGRFELLAGLIVGLILAAAGLGICVRSLQRVSEIHPPPAMFGVWPLLAAIVIKSFLSAFKFRHGRRIRSVGLVADAWNDAVDILSGLAALVALGLTLYDPEHFLAADHYGGFAVGVIVIFTGLRVIRDASLQLVDTMPNEELMVNIRRAALSVPNVRGVEKCYARKTGLQYHVDLHLEVDPDITVRASHEIATQVRIHVRQKLEWIADVLVHVEPSPSSKSPASPTAGEGTDSANQQRRRSPD
ncbi:MAG: cation transporter [Acidobacteria bacterium]|nr:cation transporter [Acidobacteriota bacterium]